CSTRPATSSPPGSPRDAPPPGRSATRRRSPSSRGGWTSTTPTRRSPPPPGSSPAARRSGSAATRACTGCPPPRPYPSGWSTSSPADGRWTTPCHPLPFLHGRPHRAARGAADQGARHRERLRPAHRPGRVARAGRRHGGRRLRPPYRGRGRRTGPGRADQRPGGPDRPRGAAGRVVHGLPQHRRLTGRDVRQRHPTPPRLPRRRGAPCGPGRRACTHPPPRPAPHRWRPRPRLAFDVGVHAVGLEGTRAGLRVDMPNPHVVVALPDTDELDGADLGPRVAVDPPQETNVELVVPLGETTVDGERVGMVRMRVQERGVGETRSCGTGACAAAVALRTWGGADAPRLWRVLVPGGELGVRLTDDGRALLTGPATL